MGVVVPGLGAPPHAHHCPGQLSLTDQPHTWSNSNPWASQLLWPNRWIDYIFSATARSGGAGHPRHTALLGAVSVNNTYPSDHHALQSNLRY